MKHVVIGIIEKTINNQKKYLLIQSQKDFGQYSGFYYPPGGHLEKGEDEISALKRELMEELNLEITSAKKINSTPGDIPNQITHWYHCETKSLQINRNKKELKHVGFFSKEEMSKISIFPATKSFFEKHIFNSISHE